MKTITKISFFLGIVALMTFNACEEAEDYLGSMTATIDSESWKSVTRVATMNDEDITITGTSSSGEIIVLTIKGTTAGTYDIDVLDLNGSDIVLKESATTSITDAYKGLSGSIELTSVDETSKKLSGTFDGTVSNTGLDSKVITGSFSQIKYTKTSN